MLFSGKLHYVILTVVVCSVVCHVRPHTAEAASQELKELRRRWGASDIVRDIDHIKEDVQKIAKMQDTGEINTQEALFYFLRMHDFDDNGKLDGHELLASISHSMDHGDDEPMPIDEKITIVDTFFAYDDNSDGFISYPELRRHLTPDTGGQDQA